MNYCMEQVLGSVTPKSLRWISGAEDSAAAQLQSKM